MLYVVFGSPLQERLREDKCIIVVAPDADAAIQTAEHAYDGSSLEGEITYRLAISVSQLAILFGEAEYNIKFKVRLTDNLIWSKEKAKYWQPSEPSCPGFTCSHCGSHRLEEVITNVTQSTEVLDIDEDGFIKYGNPSYEDDETSNVNTYRCLMCGEAAFTASQDSVYRYLQHKNGNT